jgi:hypothetical protein
MKRSLVLIAGLAAIAAAAPATAVDAGAQASAYLGFAFGGADTKVQGLRYGLQVDSSRELADDVFLPPAVKLDFSGAGLRRLSLAGLPVMQTRVRLSQDDEYGDEEMADESEWYDPRGWGWRGWAVAGASAIGASILLHDDDDDPVRNNGGNGGGDNGGGDLCDPTGIIGECLPPLGLIGANPGLVNVAPSAMDVDAGTGYMGDLLAR